MGVRFPLIFKIKMSENNGGHVDLDGESWFLFAFEDLSSRASIRKTAQNIRMETQTAIEDGLGFPADGIAIGNNGAGDLLFLRRDGDVVQSEVWIYRLRGGELAKALDDVASLWTSR
jgi:hypothetical protein